MSVLIIALQFNHGREGHRGSAEGGKFYNSIVFLRLQSVFEGKEEKRDRP